MTHATVRPSLIEGITGAALGLLFPERCQVCRIRHALPARGLVCDECRGGMRYLVPPFCHRCALPFVGDMDAPFACPNCRDMEPAFSRARSLFHATGVVREIVHGYKYHRAFWFEPIFRELWVPAVRADLAGGDWAGIVPVPLHPVKLREREFNQAGRLARLLGQALGLPVREDLVRRIEATRSQTRLTRQARAENVRRAFAAAPDGPRIKGGRWIVVDDVLTTGATTDAVSRVLRRLGAQEVVAWTLARGV